MVSLFQVSPPKPCIQLSSPHTCYMPRPSHSSRFYNPKNIWQGYRSLSSLLSSFLIPLLLRRNIPLNILFPYTLSPRSLSYQVSHPYKTRSEFIIPCVLIFIYFTANWKKIFFYIFFIHQQMHFLLNLEKFKFT